jgi:hypothetical protein
MVSKLPAFFAAYPDMAIELAASESPTTIIEDGFDLAPPARSNPTAFQAVRFQPPDPGENRENDGIQTQRARSL